MGSTQPLEGWLMPEAGGLQWCIWLDEYLALKGAFPGVLGNF